MRKHFYGIIVTMVTLGVVLFSTCGLKVRETGEDQGDEERVVLWESPPVPDSVYFMDNKVPLERFDVFENLERELLANSYFHSQTIRLIKLAPRYFSIIDPILKEEGIPSDFRYLAVAESSLNPKALSPSGAAGLWQFMRSAAGDYELEVNTEVDERYHIEKSTRAACRYLKNEYVRFKNWGLVAAAYNAGPAAVSRQLERQKAGSYFDLLMSEETERYVYRILSLKIILENYADYGFNIADEEKYPLLKTRKVELAGPVPDLADYALAHGISYKWLKYYNPWLRDISLTNKAGKRYFIDIPE